MRMLLVDDEPGLRMTLAANLELEGFEVVEAANGDEALRAAASQRFDLVLTDIRMPGMNGVELFRQLHQQRPDLPIVLMTAFTIEGLVQDALTEGAFTVVPKPFDVLQVGKMLARAAARPMVLVVDDLETDAETTAQALSVVGVKAQAVTRARDALEVVQSNLVDVCIIDLVMPDMSGAELVEELKRLKIPVAVIAMSGHSVTEMMNRVAASGVFSCLRKPFDPRELLTLVARARGAAAG